MTASARSRVVDFEHPWLGLSPFSEETKQFFFGRDREIREIFLRVREQTLTVLYGQSGLGKSSLLGAGLIPKLKVEGFRPRLIRLAHDEAAPSLIAQTLAAIGAARAQAGSATPAPFDTEAGQTLWELFHHLPSRDPENESRPLVLIFDQFEEVFTLTESRQRDAENLETRADQRTKANGPDDPRARDLRREATEARAHAARLRAGVEEFARQLADLVENRPPAAVQERILANRRLAREYDLGPSPLRAVITLREDYLSRLETWKKTMPSLMRNRMALQLLGGPQAAEAVTCPGRLSGRELVSDEVGARIVRFVAKRPPETPLAEIEAVPPLLSLVCDELNEARLSTGAPTITAEQVDLQSADILQNFYVRSFDGLHPAVQRMVEDRMVTVGGHRNSVAHEDATAELVAAGVPDPARALDQLIKGRLLSSEERAGLQRLEITHDVLTPLMVRSRRERKAREEAQLAEQKARQARASLQRSRRVNLVFAVLVLVTVGFGVWALQNKQMAERNAESARRSAELAETSAKEAKAERDRATAAVISLKAEEQAKEEARKKLAKAEAEATGRFTVTVEPAGAEVIVGADRGPSPFSTKLLRPGKHQVTVRRRGYREWNGEVEVRANETAEMAVTLELIKPFPVLDQPLENTLGMKFVPVPGTKVLFGIWDVRVQDFEAFVAATRHDATAGMHSVGAGGYKPRNDTWKNPGFVQGPTHPVCGVSWDDAMAFCAWLTNKEQAEGLLAPNQKYRLPTDAEWSVAAGLDEAPGGTPESKHRKIEGVYPWGTQWPLPRDAGNYAGTEARDANWPKDVGVIEDYSDGYPRTSPVGSFKANKFGLYDMGGNVWQWCENHFNGSNGDRVLRGASFYFDGTEFLLSSHRGYNPASYRFVHFGFRCVVGASSPP